MTQVRDDLPNPPYLWPTLNNEDRARLEELSRLNLASTQELVELAYQAIRDHAEEQPPLSRSIRAQKALVQLLAAFRGVSALGVVELQKLQPFLSQIMDDDPGSGRRKLLDFTAHLERLVQPDKRGRPRTDAKRISRLAESLLEYWVDSRNDARPGKIKYRGAKAFYAFLLPRMPFGENRRRWCASLDWGDQPAAHYADWDLDGPEASSTMNPAPESMASRPSSSKEPVPNLADGILDALPRAARRLNRWEAKAAAEGAKPSPAVQPVRRPTQARRLARPPKPKRW